MTVTVTPAQARDWIGVSQAALDDNQLQLVLDAEAQTQAQLCWIDPALAQPALEQALLRRVARAVAARSNPTGLVGLSDYGVARLPGLDAEIERYERPWRVVVFG